MPSFINQLSIRLRMTIVFSLVVCVVLLVLSLAVYRGVVNNLNSEVDRDLRAKTVELSNYVASGKNFTEQDFAEIAVILGGRGQANSGIDTKRSQDFMATKSDLSAALTYVQITDDRGTLRQAVPDLKLMTSTETQSLLRAALKKPGQFDTITLSKNKEQVRIYTEPIVQRGIIVGYVQAARSLQDLQAITNSLFVPFAVGGVMAFIGLVVVGWWITRRAFAPIENITSAAYRIGVADGLNERISVDPESNDEVSKLGRAFNSMLDRIEKDFRSQRQFIADSSHELRTPLTVIRGNLDLLKRNPDPKNQFESLQAIERESARMQRLVEDLLLLAKADAKQVVEFAPVMLDTVVLEVFKQAQILAAARHQTLKLGHFEAVKVEGDAEQLKRAILNLVDNAIKYTPEEGTITVSLHGGNRWTQVTVTDTGVGIEARHHPNIFDRFYRVDKARSRGSGGTGLGLAIVKHIAEAHRGRISLESETGKGSTFTIWLPQTQIEQPGLDPEEEDFEEDSPNIPQAETPVTKL